MKKWLLKSESGFTLVELMVVVAIIGILSAIAVPNFKKYQAKSKQSEAKIQLAAIYSTEVGASSDYDTYGTCLLQLGYEQSPRGYYRVGFTAAYDASVKISGCTGGAAAAVSASGVGTAAGNQDFSMSPILHLTGKTTYPATISNGAAIVPAGGLTFTAGAEGIISSTAASNDQWTITETKQLSNSTIGF
jgi:type IV pilus assembly protein PilA